MHKFHGFMILEIVIFNDDRVIVIKERGGWLNVRNCKNSIDLK